MWGPWLSNTRLTTPNPNFSLFVLMERVSNVLKALPPSGVEKRPTLCIQGKEDEAEMEGNYVRTPLLWPWSCYDPQLAMTLNWLWPWPYYDFARTLTLLWPWRCYDPDLGVTLTLLWPWPWCDTDLTITLTLLWPRCHTKSHWYLRVLCL